MRVCFGTLCFSSSLNDEEAPNLTATQPITRRMDSSMGDPVAELKKLLEVKEQQIEDLNDQLVARDREIATLRSQLDKFQSVLTACSPTSPKLLSVVKAGIRPRKQRAGISAEPQSEATILELSKQTFSTYSKDER